MELCVVPHANEGVSEQDFISGLAGEPFEPRDPPKPDLVLAKKACDFWVENWNDLGVEISRAELFTEFDPEECYWYFVIVLTCKLEGSLEASVEKEFAIIDKMVQDEINYEWLSEFTIITERR